MKHFHLDTILYTPIKNSGCFHAGAPFNHLLLDQKAKDEIINL